MSPTAAATSSASQPSAAPSASYPARCRRLMIRARRSSSSSTTRIPLLSGVSPAAFSVIAASPPYGFPFTSGTCTTARNSPSCRTAFTKASYSTGLVI